MKKTTISLILFSCFLLLLGSHLLAPETDTTIEELKRKVVEIGKLEFKNDVPVRYFNRRSLENYIQEIFETDYPEDLSTKENEFLYMMGFIKKKLNLRELRKKIILENVGGLYNEKTRELYALEDYRDVNIINSLTLIHELRHAIQDQHFLLTKLLGDYSDYDDRRLAMLSAIEGDATLIMVIYSGLDPTLLTSTFTSETLLSFSPLGSGSTLLTAPEIIKYQLIMPYSEGLKFVYEIFKKRKWKGVNQILKFPPKSSEQILHPQKYLKKENPIPVIVHYKPKGYTLFHTGTIGEYFLNILLKDKNSYRDFAYGWGGDKFLMFKKNTDVTLVWKSLWDTEKDCSRFFHDFRRYLEKRFRINFREGKEKGMVFIAGHSKDGYFFLNTYQKKIFFMRSTDRKTINEFISGGYYD